MSYLESIEKSKRYIMEHITETITAETLAMEAGYSLYHFCHVFSNVTSLSVGAYIRQLRLTMAADDLLQGQSVMDISCKYDFDTPSGFARAFRRHYGMSPTEFKKWRNTMKPEIKKMDAFSAACYCLAKPEGEFDFVSNTAYWLGKDFSSVSLEEYQKLTYEGYSEIGAWLHPDKTTGELCYYFGPIVKNTNYVPEGMSLIQIPAAEYAVFTVPQAKDVAELHANIQKTWKYIYTEWLDNSNWKYDESKYNFERYLGENTYIYVPICK